MVQVLSASHGPIQADAWATVTASRICVVKDDRNVAAVGLRDDIAKRLVAPFKNAQLSERDLLSNKGKTQLEENLDPVPFVEDGLRLVVEAAFGTQWENHFNRPEVQKLIKDELATQIATAQNIERQWYCTNRPALEN